VCPATALYVENDHTDHDPGGAGQPEEQAPHQMVPAFGRARGVRVDELNVILARSANTPFAQVGVVHNVIAVGEGQVLGEADLDLLDVVVSVNVFTVDVRPEFGLVHDSVMHVLLGITVSWSNASVLQPGINRQQLRKVHTRLEILQL